MGEMGEPGRPVYATTTPDQAAGIRAMLERARQGRIEGQEIRSAWIDEAAGFEAHQFAVRIRDLAQAHEAHPIRLGGRRAGRTLEAAERLHDAHKRGLLGLRQVTVPHWFHAYADATGFDGHNDWWVCTECPPAPRPIEIPELAPRRVDCGWRPHLTDKD